MRTELHAGIDDPSIPEPRRRRLRPALLLFVAITGILYWRPLLGRGDLVATDILQPLPPWSATASPGVQPYNWILGDTLDNTVDLNFFYSNARAGRFPHWNPYVAGGVPVTTQPYYYPLNAVFLVLPTHYALGVQSALRTFLAMLFMFLFLREIRVRYWASATAGVIFALSAFNIVWLGWQQSYVSVLFPALFWAAERIIKKPSPGRAAVLGAIWASMLLGGFPAVAGHAAYALVVYVAARLLMRRRPTDGGWKRAVGTLTWIGVGAAVGTIAAGIYLIPFAETYRHIDLGYRASLGTLAIEPRYLLTAFVPNGFGHDYLPKSFWGPSSNYVEVQMYAGMLTLFLAASALFLRKRDEEGPGIAFSVLFLALAVGAVLIVFGKPSALLHLVAKFPVFNNSAPGRVRDVYMFSIAAAAGLGLHAWGSFARGLLPSRRFRVALLAAVAVSAIAITMGYVLIHGSWHAYLDAIRSHGTLTMARQAFVLAGILGAASLILLGVTAVSRRAWFLEGGALALVAADLLLFAYPYWPVTPHDRWFPKTPAHVAVASVIGSDRVLPLEWALYPNSPTTYGMRDVRGHALYQGPYKSVLRSIDPNDFRSGAPTQPYVHPQTVDLASPWLDRLAVRAVALDIRDEPLALTSTPEPRTLSTRVVDAPVDIAVPAGRRIAGLQLFLREGPGEITARLRASLLDPSGKTIATSSRRSVDLRGERWNSWVLPATTIDRAGYRLRLNPERAFGLGAGDAGVAVRWLIPASGTVEPVYGDDLVVYRRTTALPRARWTSVWEVATPTVEALSKRAATSPVTLDAPPPFAPAPGATGNAEIVRDEPETVVVRTEARTAGVLVLADQMFPGWTVTVDGAPARLLTADRVARAVAVPAGRHTVSFRFAPRSIVQGYVATLFGLAALASLALAGRMSRRRKLRDDPSV